MSRDTLSDLLRTVRLRGAVFFYLEGSAPWVAEAPASPEIIPAIMPGVEHLIEFHGIAKGTCFASLPGETPVRMEAGDVILFPQGDAHVMASAPGLRAPRTSQAEFFARPPQLPNTMQLPPPPGVTVSTAPHGNEHATIICGFLGLDARPFNPLLASLPRVLHVPGRTLGADSWVSAFMRAGVDESSRKRPGGEAVLERMSEMLFVEVLRRHVDTLPAEQTGWLAGMRDDAVGRALSLLHEKPADDWTLERLSDEAALSRSSLHDRFVHFIGQPPMQYLTHWRMQVASGMLRDTKSKVVEVALNVGYESEAAFSRAFKRVVGMGPSEWRRLRKAS
jgi:AraC-like DNA-binding protein